MFEIKARLVLAILAFTLFVVVQITRVNINIAVVVLESTRSMHGISDKAIILGSFYWCYWMTELPGAFLAQKVSNGASIGASLTNALGGLILAKYDWQYLFYGTGMLSILWTLVWWRCAFDTPVQHPRISVVERQYLEEHICHVGQTKHFVPWRDMLMSKAFWAVLLATLGLMWSVITLAMQLPSYLAQVHHVDIKTNGLLLSVPDICKFIFGLKFSSLADNCIKNDRISITRARKIAVIFSHLLPATLLFLLAFYGHCHLTVAISLIISTITIGGASASGTISNMVDISPNNAGIIMGTVKTLCVIPGILSPILVQYLTTCVSTIYEFS
ncbi:Na[+]-dependent inorganic phosphate cotransporter [Carabus blaptoides fortunei]